MQHLGDAPGRGNGDELRRHDRTRTVFGIGEQLLHRLARLGGEQGGELLAHGFIEVVEEVDDAVERHQGKDRRGSVAGQALDDGGAVLECRLVQHLDGLVARQRGDDVRRLFGFECIEDVDDVGG